MAHQPNSLATSSPLGSPSGGNQPADAVGRADLPLFRFDLRQLFWFIAVLSVLLAGIVLSDGLTAVALLLAALVVAAHLFSAALGSRLRRHSDQQRAWRSEKISPTADPEPEKRDGPASVVAIQASPRSPWHGRGSTSLPWLRRLVLAGIILGGAGGGLLLGATIGHRTSAAGICVGAVSLAVLTGWFSFLGGSFYGIFRHGLRDAMAEPRNDRSPHDAR